MSIGSIKLLAACCLFAAAMASCTGVREENNQLTDREKSEGWILLFDGKTTGGWHVYIKGKIASAWVVQGGELYCNSENLDAEHGDLVTDSTFENFDLKFDWKISEKGNSGVFINVQERTDLPTTWTTGPEYQLLENSHHDYPVENKRSGCLYGFGAQKNKVDTRPAGEWNQAEIRQVNGKVEFYLNGVLTADQDFTSPSWPEMISKTNFKNFPEYGKYTQGHIGLQEWAKGISFRNIRIRKISGQV